MSKDDVTKTMDNVMGYQPVDEDTTPPPTDTIQASAPKAPSDAGLQREIGKLTAQVEKLEANQLNKAELDLQIKELKASRNRLALQLTPDEQRNYAANQDFKSMLKQLDASGQREMVFMQDGDACPAFQNFKAAAGDFGDADTPSMKTYLPQIFIEAAKGSPFFNMIPKRVLPRIGTSNWFVYESAIGAATYTSELPAKTDLTKGFKAVTAPAIQDNIRFSINETLIMDNLNMYANPITQVMQSVGMERFMQSVELTMLNPTGSAKLVDMLANSQNVDLGSGSAAGRITDLPKLVNAGITDGLSSANSNLVVGEALHSKFFEAKVANSAATDLASAITMTSQSARNGSIFSYVGFPVILASKMPAAANNKVGAYLLDMNSLLLEIALQRFTMQRDNSDGRNVIFEFTPVFRGGVMNKGRVFKGMMKS